MLIQDFLKILSDNQKKVPNTSKGSLLLYSEEHSLKSFQKRFYGIIEKCVLETKKTGKKETQLDPKHHIEKPKGNENTFVTFFRVGTKEVHNKKLVKRPLTLAHHLRSLIN